MLPAVDKSSLSCTEELVLMPVPDGPCSVFCFLTVGRRLGNPTPTEIEHTDVKENDNCVAKVRPTRQAGILSSRRFEDGLMMLSSETFPFDRRAFPEIEKIDLEHPVFVCSEGVNVVGMEDNANGQTCFVVQKPKPPNIHIKVEPRDSIPWEESPSGQLEFPQEPLQPMLSVNTEINQSNQFGPLGSRPESVQPVSPVKTKISSQNQPSNSGSPQEALESTSPITSSIDMQSQSTSAESPHGSLQPISPVATEINSYNQFVPSVSPQESLELTMSTSPANTETTSPNQFVPSGPQSLQPISPINTTTMNMQNPSVTSGYQAPLLSIAPVNTPINSQNRSNQFVPSGSPQESFQLISPIISPVNVFQFAPSRSPQGSLQCISPLNTDINMRNQFVHPGSSQASLQSKSPLVTENTKIAMQSQFAHSGSLQQSKSTINSPMNIQRKCLPSGSHLSKCPTKSPMNTYNQLYLQPDSPVNAEKSSQNQFLTSRSPQESRQSVSSFNFSMNMHNQFANSRSSQPSLQPVSPVNAEINSQNQFVPSGPPQEPLQAKSVTSITSSMNMERKCAPSGSNASIQSPINMQHQHQRMPSGSAQGFFQSTSSIGTDKNSQNQFAHCRSSQTPLQAKCPTKSPINIQNQFVPSPSLQDFFPCVSSNNPSVNPTRLAPSGSFQYIGLNLSGSPTYVQFSSHNNLVLNKPTPFAPSGSLPQSASPIMINPSVNTASRIAPSGSLQPVSPINKPPIEYPHFKLCLVESLPVSPTNPSVNSPNIDEPSSCDSQPLESDIPDISQENTSNSGRPKRNAEMAGLFSTPTDAKKQKFENQGQALASPKSTVSSNSEPTTTTTETAKTRYCVVCLSGCKFVEEVFDSSNSNRIYPHIQSLLGRLNIEVRKTQNDGGICLDCLNSLQKWQIFSSTIDKRHIEAKSENAEILQKPISFEEITSRAFKYYPVMKRVKQVLKTAKFPQYSTRDFNDADWNFFCNQLQTYDPESPETCKELQAFVLSPEKLLQISCPKCIKPIPGGREGYLSHMATKHPILQPVIPCDICGMPFPDKAILPSDDNYAFHWISHFVFNPCSKCGKRFSSKRALADHEREHHELILSCPVCSKVFTKKYKLSYHMKYFHPPPNPSDLFQCEICGQRTLSKTGMTLHQRAIHSLEKSRFACSFCKQRFDESADLTSHLLAHLEKKECAQCSVCNKFLPATGKILTEHKDRCHPPVFLCQTCGAVFKRSKHLTDHMKAHERINRPECTICQKTFASKRGLTRHMNLHQKKEKGPEQPRETEAPTIQSIPTVRQPSTASSTVTSGGHNYARETLEAGNGHEGPQFTEVVENIFNSLTFQNFNG